jgi:hypothetical protein
MEAGIEGWLLNYYYVDIVGPMYTQQSPS